MENFDTALRDAKGESANVISNPPDSHSPMRRELDSMDDFEHLDHDADSPLQQTNDNESRLLDFLKSDVPQELPKTQNFGLMDDLNTLSKDALDQFMGTPKKDPYFAGVDSLSGDGGGHLSSVIDSTRSFMDFEREPIAPSSKSPDLKPETKPQEKDFDEAPPAMKFDDDDDEEDFKDFKDFTKKKDDFIETVRPDLDEFKDFSGTDNMSFEHTGFGDNIPPSTEADRDEIPPSFEESKISFDPTPIVKSVIQEPVKVEAKPVATPEPKPEVSEKIIREPSPEPAVAKTQELPPKPAVLAPKTPAKVELPKKDEKKVTEPAQKQQKHEVIAAEAMFCQMGLDAWFNPERLNPKVESLIYWRCPKKSGAVFGVSLALLLALSCFSLISVLAYASLAAVCGCMAFRIYRNVLQAVQKTSDGHPFKDLLETDVSVSQEKAQQVAAVAVTHVNAAVSELRRLFLVEDLVDSTKFIVLLWCLTYLGSWFNGMTLIIIGFVALFTLPKVYETNKTQIDANLDVVRSKLQEITSKVKAAVPIGKKAESEKDK